VYLDAEVRVIDGQPLIVIETEEGYQHIPFESPNYVHTIDGQKIALERQGSSVILPTEDGPVTVPIEEFCVVLVDGQVVLMTEVNLVWKVGLAIAAATQLRTYLMEQGARAAAEQIRQWYGLD
jgi:hypothetical protein